MVPLNRHENMKTFSSSVWSMLCLRYTFLPTRNEICFKINFHGVFRACKFTRVFFYQDYQQPADGHWFNTGAARFPLIVMFSRYYVGEILLKTFREWDYINSRVSKHCLCDIPWYLIVTVMIIHASSSVIFKVNFAHVPYLDDFTI